MRDAEWITLTEACRLVGWWDEDESANDRALNRRMMERHLRSRERKSRRPTRNGEPRKPVTLLFDQRDPGATQAKWRTTEALLRRHCSNLFDANADLLAGIASRVSALESRCADLEERLALYEAT